jgi:hypothetical protein
LNIICIFRSFCQCETSSNVPGIQNAEKQAQKLASQLALKEFSWNDWIDQTNNIGSVGYWVKEFETDYFNLSSG